MNVEPITLNDIGSLNDLRVAVVVIKNKIIKWHNTEFTSLVGLNSTSLTGSQITQFQPPEYRKIQSQIGSKRESGLKVPSLYDSIIINKLGEKIPVTVRGMLVEYKSEICTMAILLDRRDTEGLRSSLELQLHALNYSNQHEYLRDMIEGLNHNINNHLTTLKISLDLLEKDFNSQEQKQILNQMRESFSKFSEITKFLELLEGTIDYQNEKTDLVNYLTSVFEEINNIELELQDEDVDHHSVLLDRYYFKQFLNLLSDYLGANFDHTIRIKASINLIREQEETTIILNHNYHPSDCIILSFQAIGVKVDPFEFIKDFLPFSSELDIQRGTYLSNITDILKNMGFGLELLFDPQLTLLLIIPKISSE